MFLLYLRYNIDKMEVLLTVDLSIGSCPDQFQLKFQLVKRTTVLLSFLDDCELWGPRIIKFSIKCAFFLNTAILGKASQYRLIGKLIHSSAHLFLKTLSSFLVVPLP